ARTVSVHLLIHHRAIDVRVVNDVGIHMCHSGVVTERVSFPAAAPITVSEVAVTVVNAAIKTDSRSPVALIKEIRAVVPAPPRRCPKQTNRRRGHPDAGDPIVIRIVGPVTGSPNVAFDGNGGLLYYGKRRWSDIDREAYLRERRRQRQCGEYECSEKNGAKFHHKRCNT